MDLKRTILNFIQMRYVFSFLGLLSFANYNSMYSNLSVAIVAMVNSSAVHKTLNESNECLENKAANNFSSDNEQMPSVNGKFQWDEQTQGLILGSYFWSYVFSQPFAGRTADVQSGKWITGLGMLFGAILTLLTPLAAWAGVWYLFAIRFALGITQSGIMPAVQQLTSRWAPLHERSRMITIAVVGCSLGSVFTFSISSYLISHEIAGGWPSVFYFTGIIGIVLFFFWIGFVYDSPEVHPFIQIEEKLFIAYQKRHDEKIVSIPWKKIAKSMPVWGNTAACIANLWGFLFWMAELPTFLMTILHFDISKNGVLSALPYLLHSLFAIASSVLFDKLIEKKILSLKNTRRLANSIGLIVPAILLLVLCTTGCNAVLSYSILVIALTVNGAVYSGFHANIIDISPKFSGTIFGIANAIGSFGGIIAPYVLSAFIQGKPYRSEWEKMFYITSAIYILEQFFFSYFAKEKNNFRVVQKVRVSQLKRKRKKYVPVMFCHKLLRIWVNKN